MCVCYLQDSSNDKHRLVCDLRILASSVELLPKLPAGFGSGRAPEDPLGVRPLQIQMHQHVLNRGQGLYLHQTFPLTSNQFPC